MVFSQILNLSTASWKRLLLFNTLVKMDSKLLILKSDEKNFSTEPKYKPVTHIIFDLDGLLLDTETIYTKIIGQIAESYGSKYTKATRLKVLGTTEQATAKVIVEECKLPLTVDEFLSRFKEEQLPVLSKAQLMKGAERLIQHLKQNNIPIAVATSSGEKAVEIKTEQHKELFKLFSHCVMGSSDPEVKQGKPAPDIFLVCARRFKDNPKPEKCLVFEDAPHGVTGALEAGMQVIMVPEWDLPQDKTTNATLVLKSLLDFKPEEFGLPAFGKKTQ